MFSVSHEQEQREMKEQERKTVISLKLAAFLTGRWKQTPGEQGKQHALPPSPGADSLVLHHLGDPNAINTSGRRSRKMGKEKFKLGMLCSLYLDKS